mgnify:CR=1 FL=1
MHPAKLRILVKNAAEKIYYPQCLEYLERELEPEFHDLAKATLPFYLPKVILELRTKEERRKAIDAIPNDATPKHTKDLVMSGVKVMWKKNGI